MIIYIRCCTNNKSSREMMRAMQDIPIIMVLQNISMSEIKVYVEALPIH